MAYEGRKLCHFSPNAGSVKCVHRLFARIKGFCSGAFHSLESSFLHIFSQLNSLTISQVTVMSRMRKFRTPGRRGR